MSDGAERSRASESQDIAEVLRTVYGSLTAICAAGILELSGGAVRDDRHVVIASICFAAGVPLNALTTLLYNNIYSDDENRTGFPNFLVNTCGLYGSVAAFGG